MLKIYFLCNMDLQVLCVKLHVANLLDDHLLHLVAVLLALLLAALHRRVAADQPLLQVTDRLDGLLLALVTDLPGLLHAVLGCSCTSWPSWGESSAAARRSSWARSGSSAPPQGRGRYWRTSRNICGHQSCIHLLGSFWGCY